MEIIILLLLCAGLILFLAEAWPRIVAPHFMLGALGLACWIATEIIRQFQRV